MLPVSSWPPGPPGASLSPFGAPRNIDVGCARGGFVLPKGAWIVQTGANQVVMFRPSWEKALYNQPSRQLGTGYLPGQQQWANPSCPPVSGAGPAFYRARGTISGRGSAAASAGAAATSPPKPRFSPPKSRIPTGSAGSATSAAVASTSAVAATSSRVSRETCRRPTHDQALEAWRAWQRAIGKTDPVIRPIPGRVPPNFAGWNFVGAPAATLIPAFSGGTVLADGQNVVITGGGCANITQAFSV